MCSMDLMKFIICVKINQTSFRETSPNHLFLFPFDGCSIESFDGEKLIDVLSHRFTNDFQWFSTELPNYSY